MFETALPRRPKSWENEDISGTRVATASVESVAETTNNEMPFKRVNASR